MHDVVIGSRDRVPIDWQRFISSDAALVFAGVTPRLFAFSR
jgi:hypothetical protein